MILVPTRKAYVAYAYEDERLLLNMVAARVMCSGIFSLRKSLSATLIAKVTCCRQGIIQLILCLSSTTTELCDHFFFMINMGHKDT